MNNKKSVYKTCTTTVVLISFATVSLLLTIMGCASLSGVNTGTEEAKASAKNMPSIAVAPTVAEYKPNVQVLVSGSGFEPKQKLSFLIAMGGVPSGIHYMLAPEPVPNDLGAFASVWKLGREISSKLIEPLPTVYTIAVKDKDGKTLCTAPLLFCDPKAKDKFPACTFIKE